LTVTGEDDRLGLVWRDVHRDLSTNVVIERFGDKFTSDRVGRQAFRGWLGGLGHWLVHSLMYGAVGLLTEDLGRMSSDQPEDIGTEAFMPFDADCLLLMALASVDVTSRTETSGASKRESHCSSPRVRHFTGELAFSADH